MTIVYNLNPDAVWSDGTAISAADFQATWQACLAEPGPACAGRGFDHITSISQGDSPSQVRVHYSDTYADWRYSFARGPFRADLVATSETRHAVWTSLNDHQGDFSGPYRFSDQELNRITLIRNPVWWGAEPKLDSVIVSALDDQAMILAYLRGDVDGFWVGDVNLYSQASSLPGIELRRALGKNSRFLELNCASGPLSDLTVRRAVLLGLNRQSVQNSDLAGWKGGWPLLNSPVFSSMRPDYKDLVQTNKDTVDLKAAAALLDQDGWTLGDDGVRAKNGDQLTWSFLIPQGDSLAENEAYSLRVLLADLGVRLDLSYADPADLPTMISQGQWGMAGATFQDTSPLAGAERYVSGNSYGYSSPQVDWLADVAAWQLDPADQASTLTTLTSLIWQEAPVIPLYEIPDVFMTRTGLANYGPDQLGTILWENVGWVG